MADAKLTKRDFVGPRMRESIMADVKFVKVRNDTANILCSVLNSRLLKPTILKFSFMFIEFRYNLSFRVLRQKRQLSTPKYLEKLRLTTPNYAETTTIYEKVRGLEHVCR